MNATAVSATGGENLQHHTVLVTGAGRGIGRVIAMAFAQAGANIVCVSRTESEIDSLAEEISRSHAVSALAIAADVASPSAVEGIIREANEKFGHVDILVNNAGVARFDSLRLPSFDFDSWSHIIDVNLCAPVNLIRLVLPGMISRGRGTIISIGSRAAVTNMPFTSAYSTSKTALLRFHQCLECEIRGSGIGNFYIQPGNVLTGLIRSEGIADQEAADAFPALQRMVERTEKASTTSAEVVANACVRLSIDPKARLLNGMYVDVERGLNHVLEDLEGGEMSRIATEGLYKLKLDQL